MNLTLSQVQAMRLLCTICGDDIPHNEDSQCPQAICEKLESRMHHIQCPKCRKGIVDVNTNDFFECRKCRTQYSGGIAPGHDVTKLERTFLFERDEVHNVVILPEEGCGQIQIDIMIKEARKLRLAALKAAKRKRK